MRLQLLLHATPFLGMQGTFVGLRVAFFSATVATVQYLPTFKLAQATDSNENTREIKVLTYLPWLTTACLRP
jgi:hypothetical protein